jgi:hypothetical protein
MCVFSYVGWNFVCHTGGGTQAQGVGEQGAEESSWGKKDEVTGEW